MGGDIFLILKHMKKILFPIACILAAMFCVSCGLVPEGISENDSDSLALDSIALGDMEFRTEQRTFTDSLEQNGVNASYTVTLDVPVAGNPVLVDSIKQWLSYRLGNTYEGEQTFDNEMLKHYATEYFQTCDEDGLFEGLGAYLEFSATLLTDTAGFITYEVEGYDYTGGAHGMPFNYGVTFSKEDGSQIGWDIFADTTSLTPLFKAGVADYFEEVDISDLSDFLFDGVEEDFPLPGTSPRMTSEGVGFIYGAYEIAPFAAGMPSGVIPYKKVEKKLSDKAKKLLKK